MFSIRQNFTQRSSRLPKKLNLLGMDTIYKAQPYVDVVGKNENTIGLDVINKSQPFVAAYNNMTKPFPFTPSGANHIDVQMWQYLGGSANSTTIAAMNTFCNSIDSAGLRKKFYRLNLFCGNNLASCLIPLYISTSWLSSNYGFLTDTNYNFDSNDYTETGTSGGLLGNGSTKYLDTKLTLNEAGSVGHVSCYHKGAMNTASANVLIRGGDGTNSIGLDQSAGLVRGFWSPANTASFSTNSGGHYVITRRSPTDMVLYTNGSTTRGDSTVTTSVSFPVSSWSIYVFALNNVGTASSLCPTRIQGYSIGASMTASEVSSFSTIMQTFQTSLGRN
jgi:hypothetical protein